MVCLVCGDVSSREMSRDVVCVVEELVVVGAYVSRSGVRLASYWSVHLRVNLASFTPPVCGATAADRRTIWRKVTLVDNTSSTNSSSIGTTFCCIGGLEQCFELGGCGARP